MLHIYIYIYDISRLRVNEDRRREFLIFLMVKAKGKAIPLQAWTGPEGSRRLRLPDFKTFST